MDHQGLRGDRGGPVRMSHRRPGQPAGDGGHLHKPALPLPHLLPPGQHGGGGPVRRDRLRQPDAQHGPLDQPAHQGAVVHPERSDRHQPHRLGGQLAGRGRGATPDCYHHAAAQQDDQAARGAADCVHMGGEHRHGPGALHHLELRVRPRRLLHGGAALQPPLRYLLGRPQPARFPYHVGHVHSHLRLRDVPEQVRRAAHVGDAAQPDGGQPDEDHLHGSG